MGVNLRELLEPRQLDMEELSGRKIAIDTYNVLYQFLSSIRDRFTGEPLRDSKGNITSHLSGIFYRTSKLLESGIEPIFVFDGKRPEFKKKTTEARMKIRQQAEIKWRQALKEGDAEAVRTYSQQASRLTEDMIEDAKKLLSCMGISFVQAPSEGEAQAAFMVRDGAAWGVGSSDFDSLLFGASRLITNLTVSGKRKMPRKESYVTIKPEIMELEDVLGKLGINQDQLIMMGILIGTDYAPGGVKGVGPRTALKIVKEKKNLEDVFRDVAWESENRPEKIFEFFKKPPVEKIEIKKETFSGEKIKKLLVDEHDFSEERISSAIKKISKVQDKKQSGLDRFF